MTDKKVNVAVVGYGHLGRWHAEKADAQENLVAIVEKFEVGRQRAKKAFPHVKVVTDIEEVIDDIDAALIVTPTSTHYDMLKSLITHNKHVFCEKPLCSFLDEAKEIKELYAKSDVVMQVGHSERFHESWEIIDRYKKYLHNNCVIRMNRFAPFKGRAVDVDVVQDLMIHDLDLLVYLFKEAPVAVRSTGYKILTDNWDYVCSEFVFDSGRRAYLVASRNHVKEVRDMEVVSKEGCLYVDLFKNQIQISTPDRNVTGGFVETLDYSKRDHLYIEQELFYKAIKENTRPVVDINDGLVAVKLITRVLDSLETGKVVTIE